MHHFQLPLRQVPGTFEMFLMFVEICFSKSTKRCDFSLISMRKGVPQEKITPGPNGHQQPQEHRREDRHAVARHRGVRVAIGPGQNSRLLFFYRVMAYIVLPTREYLFSLS